MDPARRREFQQVVEERLNIDTREDPDPLIDLPAIAKLGGLAPGTPGQQRQRSIAGRARVHFPEPDPTAGSRFADKPMWRAVTQICPYFVDMGNWPPGRAAREQTRGPRDKEEAA
jgi:hypothetical protein